MFERLMSFSFLPMEDDNPCLEHERPNANDDGRLPALLVDVNDVAQMLGVSARTVWRLAEVGQLPRPLHVGRAARWRTIDVLDFVDELRERAAHQDQIT